MFVTKTQIATTILLLTLACSSVCLTRHSMQAGQSAPPPPAIESQADRGPAKAPAQDAKNKDEKLPETCPIGFVHDLGKVERGLICKHAFRIVNTSRVPLRILGIHVSSGATQWSVDQNVLQPSEEGKVQVSLDTRRFRGRKTISAFLDTTDGKTTMTFVFQIKADAQDPPARPHTGP